MVLEFNWILVLIECQGYFTINMKSTIGLHKEQKQKFRYSITWLQTGFLVSDKVMALPSTLWKIPGHFSWERLQLSESYFLLPEVNNRLPEQIKLAIFLLCLQLLLLLAKQTQNKNWE